MSDTEMMKRLEIAVERAITMRPGTADSDVNTFYLSAQRAIKAVFDELRKPTPKMLEAAKMEIYGNVSAWPDGALEVDDDIGSNILYAMIDQIE